MLPNTFITDRPHSVPEPEIVPAGITLSEAVKTLRDLRREKAEPQRTYAPSEEDMLDLAITQNRQFIDKLRPATLGEFYDKYSMKFNFPEFKLPELKFDPQNIVGMILSRIPGIPKLSLMSIFGNLDLLKLDVPRNILQMEMMKRINKFKVTDISPSFSRYLNESGNPIFFMTSPIYEKQVDAETLAPSDNVSERRVKIGGADIFPENRSLTLKTKKLKQSGGKMYLPMGVIYSNDVEEDELSGLIPTRVEIVNRYGKIIVPKEMIIVSNGQIYIQHNQKSKFSEVRIIYGKPSPDHITRNLKFGEGQEDQDGLANETNLTKGEVAFRRYLENNKTVEEGSNQSQEGSLDKILKYMKNHYLRYSVLDTIKSGEKVSNARRALQHRRHHALDLLVLLRLLSIHTSSPRG